MPDGVSCVLTLAGLTLGELRLGPPLGGTHYPNRQRTPSAYRDQKTGASPLQS